MQIQALERVKASLANDLELAKQDHERIAEELNKESARHTRDASRRKPSSATPCSAPASEIPIANETPSRASHESLLQAKSAMEGTIQTLQGEVRLPTASLCFQSSLETFALHGDALHAGCIAWGPGCSGGVWRALKKPVFSHMA